jgi:hypothetical protein
MADEVKIELTDMESAPCQWILSYGDLRHVGYVQKQTGFIQLIERVDEQVFSTIKRQVEAKFEGKQLPMSQPSDIDFLPGEDEE